MTYDRDQVERYHVPLQRTAAECGPAALLGVLRFWGGDAPLSTVVRMCSDGDTETPLPTLARVAREFGFQAVDIRSSVGEIRDFTQQALLLRPAEPLTAPPFGRTSTNWIIQ